MKGRPSPFSTWDDDIGLHEEPWTPEDACIRGASVWRQQRYANNGTGMGLGAMKPRPRELKKVVEE